MKSLNIIPEEFGILKFASGALAGEFGFTSRGMDYLRTSFLLDLHNGNNLNRIFNISILENYPRDTFVLTLDEARRGRHKALDYGPLVDAAVFSYIQSECHRTLSLLPSSALSYSSFLSYYNY